MKSLTVEGLGKAGELTFDLNENQSRFIKSPAKYVGYVGGRGCGKTLALVIKIITLMTSYHMNYGLLGREDYSDLRDSTEKDFFDICPQWWIKQHFKQERRVQFKEIEYNGKKYGGGNLIFRGLKDVSKTSIRSMNLGFVALEQAEEIDESLVDELAGCMRRVVKNDQGNALKQQMLILANPWMGWVFKRFKQENRENYEFIPGSMMDNKDHLPKGFLEDQLSKPNWWKRVMVYGQFDERALNEAPVFDFELIDLQSGFTRTHIRTTEGVQIYEEPTEGHVYQIGADPSEGINDSCVAKCIDTFTGKEVASFDGRMQPDLFADKIVKMGDIFNKAKIVLEINGIGLATLTKLKDANYPGIHMREEYDKIAKTLTKKLGFRTTPATKPLLISNFNKLLEEKFVQISDERTLAEMSGFRYTDEAKKKGMGAAKGLHDDHVMAIALAYWQVHPTGFNEEVVVDNTERRNDGELLHLEDILREQGQDDWRTF